MLPRFCSPLSGLAAAAALAFSTQAAPAQAQGVHIGGRFLHIDIGNPHRHEAAYAPVVWPPRAPGCHTGSGYGRPPYHAGIERLYAPPRSHFGYGPRGRVTSSYGYHGPQRGWGPPPYHGGYHGPRW